ncbi:ATP-dependent Clp protease ATP-binding subunit ClpA [Thiolapillus sp.]|uniref:ATP-dependent Clp protease ATP-binding subunit ClpA n=1 Tax=Thiolapillus sp. TaxID=2017437 RepID=UPI0025E4FB0B
MLSQELEYVLNQAFVNATHKRQEFITIEHLLLALLGNPSAVDVLRACGADLEILADNIRQFIEDNCPLLPEGEEQEAQPTIGFQRVLQRAVFHVQASGKKEVSGANVLVAIFSEKDSQAVYFLNQQGVTRLDVVNYMAHGVSKVGKGDAEEDAVEGESPVASPEGEPKPTALESWTLNLNEHARKGKIDPLIGHEHEVERAVQILCRRRKNNPLLVGEAGVGKTAIAEGLAKKIVDKDIPEVLQDATIFSLDLGGLVAGTKYRGEFEKRLKAVLKELKKIPDSILFIDEIHTIIGAGAASGGTMDASNLIKPMLASGELRCIGSTTYQEFRGIFEKDHALNRRFQKIDVVEPSIEEVVDILKGLRSRFEEHHDVSYSDEALQAAAELADKYINDRHMPDKAIDVIDEAGAATRLQPEDERQTEVGVEQVETVVARIARIPERKVSTSDVDALRNLTRDLQMVVYGQDEAIDVLTAAIRMNRSGLAEENKPVGSFLFAGPTGVGKTEVTRQLARVLGLELIRFDMSEYMEHHAVSRLIGAPPGYVGFDQGGLLTEQITKHPHSVLLLDEIEKAHPDVFNLLLQVMDHGTLTDNNGRKADFRNVIIIMTTNAGAMEMSRRSIGFTSQDHSSDGKEVINKLFTPEFRNRLDAINQFQPLSLESVSSVVSKFLFELEGLLAQKQVTISVDEEARLWLAAQGYDPKMGARPMARLIQEKIKKPVAEELLFGKLSQGGHVRVQVKDDELVFVYENQKEEA